jgi:hypothetical protein
MNEEEWRKILAPAVGAAITVAWTAFWGPKRLLTKAITVGTGALVARLVQEAMENRRSTSGPAAT